jgi:hypothetical protein
MIGHITRRLYTKLRRRCFLGHVAVLILVITRRLLTGAYGPHNSVKLFSKVRISVFLLPDTKMMAVLKQLMYRFHFRMLTYVDLTVDLVCRLIHRKVHDTLHRYLVLLVLFIGGEPLCAPAENQTQVSGIPHRRNGHYTTGAKEALGEACPNF